MTDSVLFMLLALDVAGGFYGTISASAAALVALILGVVACALTLRS